MYGTLLALIYYCPIETPHFTSIVLLLSQLSLRLNGPRQCVHALSNRRFTLILTVVHPGHPAQRHDVRTGDPEHGQFGQFLSVRVGGNGLAQLLKGRRNRVHSSPFPGIRLDPPLPCHILVVPLLLLRSLLPLLSIVHGALRQFLHRHRLTRPQTQIQRGPDY